MAESRSSIMPTLRYRYAAAAIEWLSKVFGLERHVVYAGPDGTIGHAELKLGGGMIMLGTTKDDEYGRGFKSPEEVAVLRRGVPILWCRTQTRYMYVRRRQGGLSSGKSKVRTTAVVSSR